MIVGYWCRTACQNDCFGGLSLGVDFIFLDPSADACANSLGEHLHGDYNDPRLLAQLAERADVVTYEFENVPAMWLNFLPHIPRCILPQSSGSRSGSVNRKSFFFTT